MTMYPDLVGPNTSTGVTASGSISTQVPAHADISQSTAAAGDEWSDWAERTFGGDPVRVDAAMKAVKDTFAVGGSAEDAAASAHEAVWKLWAQHRFGNDPARVDAAVRAAKQAQAGGRSPEEVLAAAQAAVNGKLEEAWRLWAATTFPGDEAKAHAAASSAAAAAHAGATSEEAAAAARKAVEALRGHFVGQDPFNLAQPHATAPERIGAVPASPAGQADQQHGPRLSPGAELDNSVAPDLGVYDYLIKDQSDLSRGAVKLIDELQVSRHPRPIAFLGRRSPGHYTKRVRAAIAAVALAWLLIVATHIDAVRKIDGTVTPVPIALAVLVSAVLAAAITFVYLLYGATTRYTLGRGRLTVESGLLVRDQEHIELYRVTNVAVHRSLPNRLTGDGTLILSYTASPYSSKGPGNALVTGLQPFSDLERTRSQVMDLVFALRSNAVIQRYMQ